MGSEVLIRIGLKSQTKKICAVKAKLIMSLTTAGNGSKTITQKVLHRLNCALCTETAI